MIKIQTILVMIKEPVNSGSNLILEEYKFMANERKTEKITIVILNVESRKENKMVTIY